MAKIGDSTFTTYGLGTITEVDTVRGQSQFRVAGRGFNVWLDETKIHVAGDKHPHLTQHDLDDIAFGEGNDSWADLPPELRGEVQNYRNAGLETTIDPGGSYEVNKDNSTTLPYDYSPQYPVDIWAQEQTILPGDYEIDPDERLNPSDSLSGNRAEKPSGPQPSPDLFAPRGDNPFADERTAGYYDDQGDDDYAESGNKPGHGTDDFYTYNDRGGEEYPLGPGYDRPGFGHDDVAEYEDHLKQHNYEWAPGFTPDEQDIEDRSHLKHPETGGLEPGESWGHVSNYRPAGLSDRYAHFETEAADTDSPVAQFRRDPVGYINLCGHLWTDGDDSLEKYADYTQLIDIDPTLREAAWSDVRQKAMRLRHEGRVHVNDLGEGRIYATVEGDHGTYDTMIAKGGSMGGFGGGQSITNWNCSCDWGRWAFKRKMSYIGRLCSHGYAAYLTMQSNDITPESFKSKKYNPYGGKTAGALEDYKTWLSDNDQAPEAASVASYLNTNGDLDEEQVDQLYRHISKNPDEAPERDYKIDYTNDSDVAYKQADLLRTTPRSLTPNLRKVPEGEDEQWVDVEKDDRETTGPDQIVHFSAVDTLRTLHGSLRFADDNSSPIVDSPTNPPTNSPSPSVDPSTIGGFNPNSDPYQRPPSNSVGPGGTPHQVEEPLGPTPEIVPPGPYQVSPWPVYGTPEENQAAAPGARGSIPGMGIPNSIPGAGFPPHTGSRRYAESSDAGLLDKLRDLSTTPAADDLGHMDDHNDELRDVVQELQDRGYDASFMVAATQAEDNPSGGNFLGQSAPDWADEVFSGSGPNPKHWISDSASYVDENERPDFVDVTDAPDGDIIKFNDSRSKPQQGPKTSSFDTTAFLHQADGGTGYFNPDAPGADDWEQASGEPFLSEVKKDVNDATKGGGGGGNALGAAGDLAAGGDVAAGGEVAAGGGAELAELAPLVLANVRRAGRGPASQIRVDPGARQPQRPRVASDFSEYDRMTAEEMSDPDYQEGVQAMHPPAWHGDWQGMMAPSEAEKRSRHASSDDSDIVAAFQRSGAADAVMRGGYDGGNDDIAARAQAFLRTAGRTYTAEEQRELEAEVHPQGARNLPTDDDLRDTHYLLGL